MESIDKLKERIAEIEKQIKQLKSQFPKHSIPPAMMIQMDELEDELSELEEELKKRVKD